MGEYHSEGVFFTDGQALVDDAAVRRRPRRRLEGAHLPGLGRALVRAARRLAGAGGDRPGARARPARRRCSPGCSAGGCSGPPSASAPRRSSPSSHSSGSTTGCSTPRRSRSPRRCCSTCSSSSAPRPPRLAVAVGIVAGVGLLIRPSSIFAFAGILAAWVLAAGWRRGGAASPRSRSRSRRSPWRPWTIRNYVVSDGELIPISVQDGAAYGTFNDEAAERPDLSRTRGASPSATLRPCSRGRRSATASCAPSSRTRRSTTSASIRCRCSRPSTGTGCRASGTSAGRRTRSTRPRPRAARRRLAIAGIALYYVILAAALVGLWRLRRRRTLVVPLLAMALAASVIFTVASATRYRAPLEPLLGDPRGRRGGARRPRARSHRPAAVSG